MEDILKGKYPVSCVGRAIGEGRVANLFVTVMFEIIGRSKVYLQFPLKVP